MAASVPPGLEMVANEHRVEAQFLGQAAKGQQLVGAKLLGRRLVTDSQQDLLPEAPPVAALYEQTIIGAAISLPTMRRAARALHGVWRAAREGDRV